MTRSEFFEDCKKNIVFDSDNIHVTIDDLAYCPFCGKALYWQGHLCCDCKDQKEFFEKREEINNKIKSLEKDLENLNNIYTDKAFPFFVKKAIENIADLKKSLDQDEEDIKSFLSSSNPEQ
jgi:hypothetical protein